MKHDGLIKLLLCCLIGYALYTHNKTAFNRVGNDTAQKVTEIKQLFDPKEENGIPIATVKTSNNPSGFEKTVAEVANTVLNTSQAKNIVNKIAHNLSKYKEISDIIKKKGYYPKDIEQGAGQNVRCGQNITIQYTTPSSSNDESTPKKSALTITLGNGSLPKQIEAGIVGMKIGGVRKISFYKDKEKPISSTVSLDKINNDNIEPNLSCLAK